MHTGYHMTFLKNKTKQNQKPDPVTSLTTVTSGNPFFPLKAFMLQLLHLLSCSSPVSAYYPAIVIFLPVLN
jgi:hypothetical protein